MVFDERREGIKPIGIVQHADVMIDSPRHDWVCHVCCPFLAKVSNYYGELVMFRQMAQHDIVVCVRDVEDEECASSPVLGGEESRFG